MRGERRWGRRFGVVVTASVIAGATVFGASPARAATRRTLADSQPRWAVARNRVGAVDGRSDIVVRVYLQLRDRAGLDAIARDVSDPASPSYRQFLTAAETRARFAPTPATVSAVRAWLAGNGLRLLGEPANRLYVEAAGPAARIARTFGVQLANYRLRGRMLRAADRDLSVPPELAPMIAGVVGVDDAQLLLQPDHVAGDSSTRKPAPPPDGFRNGRPCSAFWGEQVDTTDPAYGGGFPSPLPYAPCGYTPPQLRAAYGVAATVAGGHSGASATVAIIDAFAAPTIFQDASTYATRNDPGHPLKASQFSQVVFPPNRKLQGPDQCDASGWYGEETLDVEAVHAMAPGAHIVYIGGRDCTDPALDKALNDVVANSRARIVTNSYGDLGEDLPIDLITSFDEIAVQAAVQGIGVYFSSGDSGDEVVNLGKPEADFPASDPWVTAVGGTTLGIDAHGGVALETGWETGKSTLDAGVYAPAAPGDFLYGSGGGTSALFREPWYQKDVVPRKYAIANGPPLARVVPDISMLGDPNTGMLIGETQTFAGEGPPHYDEYRIGGTSLSSPLFAGMMALADDVAGSPHGFVNPSLYGKARRAHVERDILHVNGADVRIDFLNGINANDGTVTSVRTFDFTGQTIATAPGYDTTTGLGVPRGAAFLAKI